MTLSGLDPINFRDASGASVDRAKPHVALIEKMNRYGWRVLLPDGDRVHHVLLARDGDGFVGRCHSYADDVGLRPCKGHKYGDGPCAHLCTLWRADFVGTPDVEGYTVRISHVDDDHDVGRTTEPQLARADGGVRR
jgi:hypothetical protein